MDSIFKSPVQYTYNLRSSKSKFAIFAEIFAKWHKLNNDSIIGLLVKLIDEIAIGLFVLDDIQDDSARRRGKPCAHKIYGKEATLLALFFNFIDCMSKIDQFPIDQLKKNDLQKIIFNWVNKTVKGLAFEKYYSNHMIVPSEDQIKEIIILKCSSTLKAISKMIKIFTESELELDMVCDLFALYGQMNNDLDTFLNNEYFQCKSFAEDITEGKFSIPIVHAINSNPDDSTMISILRLKTEDIDLKKLAMKIMEESGSFDYSKKLISQVKTDLIKELSKFEKNELIYNLINQKYDNFT